MATHQSWVARVGPLRHLARRPLDDSSLTTLALLALFALRHSRITDCRTCRRGPLPGHQRQVGGPCGEAARYREALVDASQRPPVVELSYLVWSSGTYLGNQFEARERFSQLVSG